MISSVVERPPRRKVTGEYMYYVYILEDISTGSRYTGHTNNLERRLHEHTSKQSSFTSVRGPYRLLYTENFATRAEAMKREKYLKTGKGREELKKLFWMISSVVERFVDIEEVTGSIPVSSTRDLTG